MNNPLPHYKVTASSDDNGGQRNTSAPHTPFWQRALIGLFILAMLYTLYAARNLLLPVVLALLLSFLLAPVKNALERLRIPGPLAAGIVVLSLVAALGYGLISLSEPVSTWFNKIPQVISQIERKMYPIKKTVQEVNKAAEKVEQIASGTESTRQVTVQNNTIRNTLQTLIQNFFVQTMIIGFLIYFFLASGDQILRKLVKILPELETKKRAVTISHQIQTDVSTYLLTISLINIGLGLITAAAMYYLDMPNPVLWGVVAALLNFIPYLGPVVTLGILTTVALLSFNTIEEALIVPITFFIITTIEGQLVTPILLGQRLSLSPMIVFLCIMWWAWLWGTVGAIIAVPLLVITKIALTHIKPLQPYSEFLGR